MATAPLGQQILEVRNFRFAAINANTLGVMFSIPAGRYAYVYINMIRNISPAQPVNIDFGPIGNNFQRFNIASGGSNSIGIHNPVSPTGTNHQFIQGPIIMYAGEQFRTLGTAVLDIDIKVMDFALP